MCVSLSWAWFFCHDAYHVCWGCSTYLYTSAWWWWSFFRRVSLLPSGRDFLPRGCDTNVDRIYHENIEPLCFQLCCLSSLTLIPSYCGRVRLCVALIINWTLRCCKGLDFASALLGRCWLSVHLHVLPHFLYWSRTCWRCLFHCVWFIHAYISALLVWVHSFAQISVVTGLVMTTGHQTP